MTTEEALNIANSGDRTDDDPLAVLAEEVRHLRWLEKASIEAANTIRAGKDWPQNCWPSSAERAWVIGAKMEIANLREDKVRLEWLLAKNSLKVDDAGTLRTACLYYNVTREDIDAAMLAQEP